MKNLKKRIQEEMVLTDEDKLIFEILGEKPHLIKYEKEGRIAFRKLVIEKCKKCEKYYYYHDTKCNYIFNPIFTKDWNFKCFMERKEEK